MNEWLNRLLVVAAGIVILVIGTTWLASGGLQDPATHFVGASAPDLHASNITFASGSAVLIHGWLMQGKPKQGVVLLLHAVRRVERAEERGRHPPLQLAKLPQRTLRLRRFRRRGRARQRGWRFQGVYCEIDWL